MKKIIAILMAAAILLATVSCGAQQNDGTAPDGSETPEKDNTPVADNGMPSLEYMGHTFTYGMKIDPEELMGWFGHVYEHHDNYYIVYSDEKGLDALTLILRPNDDGSMYLASIEASAGASYEASVGGVFVFDDLKDLKAKFPKLTDYILPDGTANARMDAMYVVDGKTYSCEEFEVLKAENPDRADEFANRTLTMRVWESSGGILSIRICDMEAFITGA